MLARAHRFHGHASLPAVYRQGQTIRGSLASLKYRPRKPGQGYRLGVVVSRKVHKSAVVRNRIRRRVYELVRTGLPDLGSYDLVITIYDDSLQTCSPAQLQAIIIDSLLQKLPVLDNQSVPRHGIVKQTGNA